MSSSRPGSRMPQLTVRNLSKELVRALKMRAACNGRSAEAEHRLILARALKTTETDFWARADALRATTNRNVRVQNAPDLFECANILWKKSRWQTSMERRGLGIHCAGSQ